MANLARRRLAATPGPGNGYLSSVTTDDAAAAVVVAATEAPGGIYNVVDDEPVTRQDFDRITAAAVGRPRLRRVPDLVLRLLGDKLDHVVRSHRVSNAALRRATSWVPTYPSVRSGMPSIVETVVAHSSLHQRAS